MLTDKVTVAPGAAGPVMLWLTTVPWVLPLAWLVWVTVKPRSLSCLLASEDEIPTTLGTVPTPEPFRYVESVGGSATGPKLSMIGFIVANQVRAGS